MMYKLILVISLLFILINIGCEKPTESTDYSSYSKIKVIGVGADCQGVYLVQFLEKTDQVFQVTGTASGQSNSSPIYYPNNDIFYADNLPDKFKVNNKTILIKFRTLEKSEAYPCTAMGPGYSHVWVTEAIE